MPFLNKGSTRGVDQDAAEAQKNKNWDPNSPLYGKSPTRAVTPASAASGTDPARSRCARSGNPTKAAARQAGKGKPIAQIRWAIWRPPRSARRQERDPFDYFGRPEPSARSRMPTRSAPNWRCWGKWEARVMSASRTAATSSARVGPSPNAMTPISSREKLAGAGVEAALVRDATLNFVTTLAQIPEEEQGVIE